MVTKPGGTSMKNKARNCAVVVLTSGPTQTSWRKRRLHRLGISTLVGLNIIRRLLEFGMIDVYFRRVDFVLGFEMDSAGTIYDHLPSYKY
jgi:hypothetical protein